MKYLAIVLVLLITFSCKTKSTLVDTRSTDSTSVVNNTIADTVFMTTIIRDTVFKEVTQQQNQDVTLNNPCDSITGVLKDFIIKAGNTTIESKNGALKVKTECDEAISIYQKNERQSDLLIKELRRMVDEKTKTDMVNIQEKETKTLGFWGKLLWFVFGLVIGAVLVFLKNLFSIKLL